MDIEIIAHSSIVEQVTAQFPAEERMYVRQYIDELVNKEVARLLKEKDGVFIITDSVLEARRETRNEGKSFGIYSG
jgi:hypothetical protein